MNNDSLVRAKARRDGATQRAYRINGVADSVRYVVKAETAGQRYAIWREGINVRSIMAPTCDAALTEYLRSINSATDNSGTPSAA